MPCSYTAGWKGKSQRFAEIAPGIVKMFVPMESAQNHFWVWPMPIWIQVLPDFTAFITVNNLCVKLNLIVFNTIKNPLYLILLYCRSQLLIPDN